MTLSLVQAAASLFPAPSAAVPRDGGPVCSMAVDAEEDFDWQRPVASIERSTECMRHIGPLQEIAGAYGIVPTYLLTYPVLGDAAVVELLRYYLAGGKCDLGVQLHPWVTPPFGPHEGRGDPRGEDRGASFSGNLAPGFEERKLLTLNRRFAECFGRWPRIYRAGRYGLGPNTAAILEREGFTIDTSVAPRTSAEAEGGPDYSAYDYQPFWFGAQRRLLELPLCRSIVGWGGRLAPDVYPWLDSPWLKRLHVGGVVTRLGFAERITLSPEGNDVAAMLRLVRRLRVRGQATFVLSFHSSSLRPGRNPYVRTRADLHRFYDKLSGVLHALATRQGFRFAPLAALPALLRE